MTEQYTLLYTKVFRGNGFMTISKYDNQGKTIYIGDKESKVITSINTDNWKVNKIFSGHTGVIWNLDISSDDSILISSSGDLTICFWNTHNGTLLFQTLERCIPKFVCAQKNNNKSNYVAVICEALTKKSSTCIKIFDLDDLNNLEKCNNFKEKYILEWKLNSKPSVLTWLNDNILIVGTSDGKIILKNIIESNEYDKEYLFHTDCIKSIVWNKTYTQILTSSLDCTSKQINVLDWSIKCIYTSTVPINWACWNHNEKKVMIGGGIEAMNVAKTSNNDLNLKIFRTSDQKLMQHLSSHFGPIRYIDKSPINKNFVTSSQDGTVKIYFEEPINLKNQIESTYLDLDLSDEINKLENLSWKPKQKQKTESKQIKWIPGMSKPKDNESEKEYVFGKISSNSISNNDIDFKLKQIQKEQDEYNSTIRVTNLPNYIQSYNLAEIFDLFGRIERDGIRIKKYDDTTMAFIKYVYPESAIKAINNMDGTAYEYNIIHVELAKQKSN